MTVAALEAEAVALMDAAAEHLDRALLAFQSRDDRLASRVLTAVRRSRAGADMLYESALGLLGQPSPPAGDVRRRAALLHVVARIRHVALEVSAIARLTQDAGVVAGDSTEEERALELMGELTLTRLTLARDAYARQSSRLAGELMATGPELGVVNAPVLRGPAVGVARCLERIEDDAIEIGEQVVFVSSGFFREMADSPWVGDPPTQSSPPVFVS